MPVRVKCRCGQELVLRYGEWVYLLLGAVLLGLVVNSVAVLLLYVRLEERTAGSRPRAEAETRAAPAADPAPPAGVAAAGDAAVTARARSTAAAGAGAETASPAAPPPDSPPPAPSEAAASGTPPAPDPRPAGGEAPRDSPPRDPRAANGDGTPPRRPGLPLTAPGGDAEAIFAANPPWKERDAGVPAKAWLAEASLLRLFVLERLEGEPFLAHAFLLDPDAKLRRAALERVIARGPPQKPEDGAAAAAFVRAASRFLAGDPRGKKVLAAYGSPAAEKAGEEEDPAVPGELDGVLDALRARVARALAAPGPGRLKTFLDAVERQGMDVVLLVDGSRSMEGALEAFQADALWLFPALPWTFPGLRLGVIVYRDAVDTATGFADSPGGVLQALRDARPEGGGDVPEGVHQAVKAALSLGRFAWRREAEKHLVLIGDAPPPYAEVHALLSLARSAFGEGRYRLHALSVRPGEGAGAVPFFPELAKEGGGVSVTITDPGTIAAAVFVALLPPEAASIAGPLAAASERIFRGEE